MTAFDYEALMRSGVPHKDTTPSIPELVETLRAAGAAWERSWRYALTFLPDGRVLAVRPLDHRIFPTRHEARAWAAG